MTAGVSAATMSSNTSLQLPQVSAPLRSRAPIACGLKRAGGELSFQLRILLLQLIDRAGGRKRDQRERPATLLVFQDHRYRDLQIIAGLGGAESLSF